MPPLPHITVLMGTRNGSAHLGAQLASLTAQDHANWSLWVSDDGSTDDTQAILRAFAKDRPNPVLLFQGPRAGMSANYLSLLCHPDLPTGPVAFADQDDIWLPNHLSRGLSALAMQPDPQGQAYVAHRLILRSTGVPRTMPWRGHRPASFRNALVENLLAGSGLILDAPAVALARRIGSVDVPYWDWWLYLLLTGTGAQVLHDARPGLLYRAHAGNTHGPRYGLRAKLWRIEQLRNGTYRRWVMRNLAALEPHIKQLTPEAQAALHPLLPVKPHIRLRRLSKHRHWRQDQLALWLTG